MHLVRRTDDLPSIVDDIDRIVNSAAAVRHRQSSTLTAPATRTCPSWRTSAIRARASGLSVRMKGIDVSRPTTMSGRLGATWTGAAVSERWSSKIDARSRSSSFLAWSDHRLDDADGHLRLERHRCRLGEPVKSRKRHAPQRALRRWRDRRRAPLPRPDQSRRGEDENGQHVESSKD